MSLADTGGPPLADALRLAATAWLRFVDGAALDRALAAAGEGFTPMAGEAPHPRLAAAAQDIVFTATRHRVLTGVLLQKLATRPPDPGVAALLAVALPQLLSARHAEYAVVDQTVRAAKADPLTQAASGFVNAVLRNALRRRDALIAEAQRDETVRSNLPRWWLKRLQAAYPQQWRAIAAASNVRAPLTLRVNRRRGSVEHCRRQLAAAGIDALQVGEFAIALPSSRPVREIPGFDDGTVTVQDAGAQLAVHWLGVGDGMSVLDACAAPGGKTAQLAECAAGLTIDAVDIDPQRLPRIDENLGRLRAREHAQIRLHVADAADTWRYAAGRSFDRVLLDAPCTASGIVGRHPDIPWLRQPADVAQLATLQARLLDALWPLVAPAGRLLYVVCSVFPEEGVQQVERFAARHRDARPHALGSDVGPEMQLLPVREPLPWTAGLPTAHDGFFYALFEKA